MTTKPGEKPIVGVVEKRRKYYMNFEPINRYKLNPDTDAVARPRLNSSPGSKDFPREYHDILFNDARLGQADIPDNLFTILTELEKGFPELVFLGVDKKCRIYAQHRDDLGSSRDALQVKYSEGWEIVREERLCPSCGAKTSEGRP